MKATMESLDDYAARRMVRDSDNPIFEIPKSTYDRLMAMKKRTRQGVPDLNGPRLNGTGYNGHKSATCAHHKAPDATPTHITERLVATVDNGIAVLYQTKRFTCCSACGVELYENK
jgi:hypothetical protein